MEDASRWFGRNAVGGPSHPPAAAPCVERVPFGDNPLDNRKENQSCAETENDKVANNNRGQSEARRKVFAGKAAYGCQERLPGKGRHARTDNEEQVGGQEIVA